MATAKLMSWKAAAFEPFEEQDTPARLGSTKSTGGSLYPATGATILTTPRWMAATSLAPSEAIVVSQPLSSRAWSPGSSNVFAANSDPALSVTAPIGAGAIKSDSGALSSEAVGLNAAAATPKAITLAPAPTATPETMTFSPDVDATVGGAAAPKILAAATAVPNKIVLENQKQGNPESEWELRNGPSSSIEGFATDISFNVGETVTFKINTTSSNYRIDIYRLGYYGGMGARKVGTINHQAASAINQPDPLRDASTGLVDAGNWQVTDSWTMPSDMVSGIYIAKLVRQDGTTGENHIPFIVRDDASTSDIVFQTADTTWHAYNGWGGANLYGGNGPGGDTAPGRAYKVSYNRPIITREGGGTYAGPQDFIFGAEYSALRWMEMNGYDVSYISGVDADRYGELLLNHKIYTSVGHDEYWSGDQRANVEAARDAGVHLAFLSGNEVYWKTRWEDSIDSSGTDYRTLVSYKETRAGGKIDPSTEWTGTWRDLSADPAGGARPENELTGTMFQVDSYRSDAIKIPYGMTKLRFWRDTDVADTLPGNSATLVKNVLGYEWDISPDNGFRPDGLIKLSNTTLDVDTILVDYGTTVAPGTATHNLTLYRAPSGALIFGAGTVYWSWGLDANHDLEPTPTDPSIQQAMVNLFADMGVQPQTLQASLNLATASTDLIAPTSVIGTLGGTSVAEGQRIVISGSASDAGGQVAAVEISTDGGATWWATEGTPANWTYTWRAPQTGTYTVLSRAVDDSLNMETPATGMSMTVTPADQVSLFQGNEGPSPFHAAALTPATACCNVCLVHVFGPTQLGVKIESSRSGTISGLRFYKNVENTGPHVGSLWTASGQLLARASFTNETASGWQQVNFATPVTIAADTTYVASYHTTTGVYLSSPAAYFAIDHKSGPLTALASNWENGPNGLIAYGDVNTFPTGVPQGATNYWVDVVFNPATTVGNQAPVARNDSGLGTAPGVPLHIAATTLLANDSDPNNDPLAISSVGGAVNGTVAYNAGTQTVTFTPQAGYTGPASFTYTVTDGRTGTSSASVSVEVDPALTTLGLFNPGDAPSVVSTNDSGAVELGVRFQSNVAGSITGIRFYKGPSNTGTHIGNLWDAAGRSLATATFTAESASGWQQVNFAVPVAITAGTTYVASYHTTSGYYSSTPGYFSTAHSNGPLTAPADGTGGGNGVYAYGGSSQFPGDSYSATNYWVDVMLRPNGTQSNQPPVAVADSGFSTARDTVLQIAASALLGNDSDPNGDTLSITGVSGATNGTVAYNSTTQTISFTPTAGYTGPGSFSYTVSDGRGGTATAGVSLTVAPATNQPPVAVADSGFSTARDMALQIAASALLGNDSDPNGDTLSITGVSGATNGTVAYNSTTQTISFTPTAGYTGPGSFSYTVSDGRGGTATAGVSLIVTSPSNTASLFGPGDTPDILADDERQAVELGVKFTASTNGTINGIRFYKGAANANTGTHTGSLWDATGVRMATATFTNETATGWQQVNFANPVAVTAGTTYVASYHTSTGGYAASPDYFSTAHASGPLTAPSSATSGGNGVFAYGSGGIAPNSTFGSTNYWVDVVFTPAAQQSNQPPVAVADSGFSTARDTALHIAASALLGNDSDPNGDALSIAGVGGASNGTVAYNSTTRAISFTPTAGYTGPGSFSYTVSDGRGGTAAAGVSLTVTSPSNTASLFGPGDTPGILVDADRQAVELGVKFTASTDGTINGIRFYKGAANANTGTHTGSLWDATGVRMATATFTNETATGWQQVNFANPVAVTAGTTYVASYHTSTGGYAASP
ncbi:DUF4082 domain-containing protein, partial [Roseomonas xinghualingensis]|uniref:DUF4082 domain-containing protein n=1 Tax=Roseomonas xinghualingensis TaxID=2986475 RepID=UPI0021F15B14